MSGGLAAEEEGAERRDLPLGDEAAQSCLYRCMSNHHTQWPKTITIVYFAHESAVCLTEVIRKGSPLLHMGSASG